MSVNWMLMHKISSFSCSLEVITPELKFDELDSKGANVTSCKQACNGLLRCSCRNVCCWDMTMQFFRARDLAAFLAAFWITAYPADTRELQIRWLETTTAWTGPTYPVMQKGLQPTGTCPTIPTAFPTVSKEFLGHAGFSKGSLGTGKDS